MLSISYIFSPTTVIESGQANQNFSDIVNYINNTACVTDMVVGWKGAVVDIPTGWELDTDLLDRFILGAGNLYALGALGGEASHTLTVDEIPSHAHSIARIPDGGAATNFVAGSTSGGNTPAGTGSTGGGQAHNNMPPYYALCWIKKS